MLQCPTCETDFSAGPISKEELGMNNQLWETVDNLYKVLDRRTREMQELEARVYELERRLRERTTDFYKTFRTVGEHPSERAA